VPRTPACETLAARLIIPGGVRPRTGSSAVSLRCSFRPLRPDLDRFLFAAVGDEIDDVPLSVLSALTRVGVDPWEEAGRLSSLARPEAVEQLARLIIDLSGRFRSLPEAREIADSLVGLLPRHDAGRISAEQIQIRSRFPTWRLPRTSSFWVVCFVFAAAALLSALAHGGFPFGIGTP
jgi:hypothetical protein